LIGVSAVSGLVAVDREHAALAVERLVAGLLEPSAVIDHPVVAHSIGHLIRKRDHSWPGPGGPAAHAVDGRTRNSSNTDHQRDEACWSGLARSDGRKGWKKRRSIPRDR